MGGLSREEYDALDTRDRKRLNRKMTVWQGQNKEEWASNIKGDASSITPKANNNIDSISSQASYDSNEGSTQFIPLPLVEGGGGTSGSTSSSSGGGGGGGSSEDASDPLLTLYMGK